ALGGLPHRAGDLVGDSVPVRPNRMDPTDLGEDWGEGRRERSMTARSRRIGVAMLVAAGGVPLPSPLSLVAQDTTVGKKVYVKWCAGCNGGPGAAAGPAPAYMLPRPPTFTGAVYKIRTTPSGQLQTAADLLRPTADGLPAS